MSKPEPILASFIANPKPDVVPTQRQLSRRMNFRKLDYTFISLHMDILQIDR